MIFAAGLGSRLKPWTDEHPKALALVNGKSLLQRNIEYLQLFDIRDVIVNVHHFSGQIVEAISANKGWGSRISISDESDRVLETGGGLKKAGWYFDGDPFLVMNVDILTDLDLNQLIRYHRENRPLATLAISARETSRYFLFTPQRDLCGWINTRSGEEKGPVHHFPEDKRRIVLQKAFSGIHLIEPAIFSRISREGNFSIVDLYLELCGDFVIKGFEHDYSRFIDVGKPAALARAETLYP